MLDGSKSTVCGPNTCIDIFDSGFEREFTELAVPESGRRPVTVALLQHAKRTLDDGPAVVDIVVDPGIMSFIKTIKLSMFDYWSGVVISEL